LEIPKLTTTGRNIFKTSAAVMLEETCGNPCSTRINKYLFRDRNVDDRSSVLSGLPNFSLEDEGRDRGISSFLPSLCRFLIGEQKPSQPQISWSDYIKEVQDNSEKYFEANTKSLDDTTCGSWILIKPKAIYNDTSKIWHRKMSWSTLKILVPLSQHHSWEISRPAVRY